MENPYHALPVLISVSNGALDEQNLTREPAPLSRAAGLPTKATAAHGRGPGRDSGSPNDSVVLEEREKEVSAEHRLQVRR